MEFNLWSGRLIWVGFQPCFLFFLGVFIVALLAILGNPGYHVDKPNEIPEDWVDDDAVDDDENRCIDHSGILSIFGM